MELLLSEDPADRQEASLYQSDLISGRLYIPAAVFFTGTTGWVQHSQYSVKPHQNILPFLISSFCTVNCSVHSVYILYVHCVLCELCVLCIMCTVCTVSCGIMLQEQAMLCQQLFSEVLTVEQQLPAHFLLDWTHFRCRLVALVSEN